MERPVLALGAIDELGVGAPDVGQVQALEQGGQLAGLGGLAGRR